MEDKLVHLLNMIHYNNGTVFVQFENVKESNVDDSFFTSLDKVGVGIYIKDDHEIFMLTQTEWFSTIIDVHIGEVLLPWNGCKIYSC